MESFTKANYHRCILITGFSFVQSGQPGANFAQKQYTCVRIFILMINQYFRDLNLHFCNIYYECKLFTCKLHVHYQWLDDLDFLQLSHTGYSEITNATENNKRY